jgi:hypothetical protein
MHHVGTTIAVSATVAALAASPSWSAAVARAPGSDHASDATGDVVRTYADGSTATGYGRSDIRSLSLARTTSPGGNGPRKVAATASVRITDIDHRLQSREVRLIVRWVTDTGHRARTMTFFGGKRGGRTYLDGLPPDECAPYIDVHPRRNVLGIALANDGQCWPGASSLRARAWVRYRFSKHGFARDMSPRVGPVAVPAPPAVSSKSLKCPCRIGPLELPSPARPASGLSW